MSSYSPLPNTFFRKHCKPDLETNPIYGITHRPIQEDMRNSFMAEIEDRRIKVEARVNSGKTGIRQVKAWRIPLDTNIAMTLNFIIAELNEIYNYRISCIQDIQYLEYEKGDYYDWHTDIADGISSLRKISISYVLNDDFDGGELEFFHGGEKTIINATKNSLVAFTSFINHRVHKVTRGVRKALVVWVNGESWR